MRRDVLADDVEDAGLRFLGVVQIGDAVAETRPEMQQVAAGRSSIR